jgi:hypothetical protein
MLVPAGAALMTATLVTLAIVTPQPHARAQQEPPPSAAELEPGDSDRGRQAAGTLCDAILAHLTVGPPLETKLRLRAWAAGESVLAVGSYIQAGRGQGWMRMELQTSIADGKGLWQQTCDGRLAWTREELGDQVRVRRVDLGRLRQPARRANSQPVPAWLRVGGLAELIDRIAADYRLTLSRGHIGDQEMWVLKGALRDTLADPLRERAGGTFPQLVPRLVRVAVPADQLEAPLPARIEFWDRAGGKLLSLLEIYDATTIDPPPVTQFRFEAGGDDFVNETEIYMQRFGFVLAEKEAELR